MQGNIGLAPCYARTGIAPRLAVHVLVQRRLATRQAGLINDLQVSDRIAQSSRHTWLT